MPSNSKDTLKSLVNSLLARSKRAVRLYSRPAAGRETVTRSQQREPVLCADALSSEQTDQWRAVNHKLSEALGEALTLPDRDLRLRIVVLGEEYSAAWRAEEAELHREEPALKSLVEKRDFIAATLSARSLGIRKARMQATRAAFVELQTIIEKCRLSPGSDTVATGFQPIDEGDAPDLSEDLLVESLGSPRLRRVK